MPAAARVRLLTARSAYESSFSGAASRTILGFTTAVTLPWQPLAHTLARFPCATQALFHSFVALKSHTHTQRHAESLTYSIKHDHEQSRTHLLTLTPSRTHARPATHSLQSLSRPRSLHTHSRTDSFNRSLSRSPAHHPTDTISLSLTDVTQTLTQITRSVCLSRSRRLDVSLPVLPLCLSLWL